MANQEQAHRELMEARLEAQRQVDVMAFNREIEAMRSAFQARQKGRRRRPWYARVLRLLGLRR